MNEILAQENPPPATCSSSHTWVTSTCTKLTRRSKALSWEQVSGTRKPISCHMFSCRTSRLPAHAQNSPGGAKHYPGNKSLAQGNPCPTTRPATSRGLPRWASDLTGHDPMHKKHPAEQSIVLRMSLWHKKSHIRPHVFVTVCRPHIPAEVSGARKPMSCHIFF